MTRPNTYSKFLTLPAMALGLTALAGCLGPTYGTDKTVTEQLVEDLGSALSLRNPDQVQIDHTPRPDIVRPANATVLPPPQQNVTEQASETAWPEAQEQRRARIVRGIDEGTTDARFVGGQQAVAAVGASEGPGSGRPPGSQRTFLTDPPTEYITPVATAPVGEIGESEAVKQRRLRRASGERSGLGRLWPF